MRTELNQETGRILVINDIPDTKPQAFTVCVKNPEDWEEIHNYIINENEIDGIPNRRIECTADMPFSTKRAVYEISVEEANILRSHPKIEWVEESSMYNQHVLEQRKVDEPFDRHTSTNRYKQEVVNRRVSGDPTPVDNSLLNFTQWGIHRHQFSENPYVGAASTTLQADSQYTLTGKNVDIVIMDTGVRWDHPEFLKPGYTSVVGVATTVASRVRDILIHGQSEYGIDWASEGLTPPGLGILADYTIANVLESSSFNGSWHGSHCAGTASGNQFGLAFEANIWSIACVDRSDVGWGEPSDGFDYIRMWHKNKPINPETGRKNPTVVNCSWGHRQFVSISGLSTATYRGTTYSSPYSTPAISNISDISNSGTFYEFTTRKVTGQTTMNELLDDPDCQDIIIVCAAGNSGDTNGKQDLQDGIDYNNQFLSGVYYESGYDNYYNRSGTPAIGHQGKPDAVIIVGSIDSLLATTDDNKERLSYFTNRGPAIDVFAAGSTILSPYNTGYYDPRNFSYYNNYLSGTSMATPNVAGLISLHLESNPKANRIDVRNWLLNNATKDAPLSNLYTDDSVSTYWSNNYTLRGSNPRVLFNPYANNESPKVEGIAASGISFTQS